jgi:hypothetical protein
MNGVKMKTKLINYFTQRSTWCGIGAAVLAVISYAKPEWTTVAAGILTALGLGLRDKKN